MPYPNCPMAYPNCPLCKKLKEWERSNTPLAKLNKKLEDLAKDGFSSQKSKEKTRFFKAKHDLALKVSSNSKTSMA